MSYSYDANGNQTDRGTDSYEYDHEDRLAGATVGGSAPHPARTTEIG